MAYGGFAASSTSESLSESLGQSGLSIQASGGGDVLTSVVPDRSEVCQIWICTFLNERGSVRDFAGIKHIASLPAGRFRFNVQVQSGSGVRA